MADTPKMLSATDLAAIRDVYERHGHSLFTPELLSHIAAQDAEIAKLQAAVRAGDAVAAPNGSNMGDKDENYQCAKCRHGWALTPGGVRHNKWCPVPTYRAARAAVTLPEDAS